VECWTSGKHPLFGKDGHGVLAGVDQVSQGTAVLCCAAVPVTGSLSTAEKLLQPVLHNTCLFCRLQR